MIINSLNSADDQRTISGGLADAFHPNPRSSNSFSSSELKPTTPIAQICSALRPAMSNETFSSGGSLFYLEGWPGPIGMSRWSNPTLAAHDPAVESKTFRLELGTQLDDYA